VNGNEKAQAYITSPLWFSVVVQYDVLHPVKQIMIVFVKLAVGSFNASKVWIWELSDG
jgi:hypothetical protein